MMDGFHRLRHDAVIGGDHQHDNVGHLGAARAHRREGGVAGRIDEGNLAAQRRGHLIGANVLGDAAGLARHDVGGADGVEQRRLAVIDVAHDGHHRCARHHVGRIVGGVEQTFFDVGLGDAANRVAHFLGDDLRGVGVDHVVDRHHLALLHHQTNNVDRAFRHAVGEIGDGDGFGNRHLAHELFLRLVGRVALEALGAAAERGDRTFAHFVGAQGGNQRETSAFLRRGGARRRRTGGGRTGGTGSAGTARHARRVVVLGFNDFAASNRLLDLFLDHQALLGDFAGLALGFFLDLVARVFFALA